MDENEQGNNPENPQEGQENQESAQDNQDMGTPKPETSDLGLNEFETPQGHDNHDKDLFDPFEANNFLSGGHPGEMNAVYNVPVQVSAVLGKAVMPVSQLLKLGRGAVVELDRRVGESIEIYVNNRLIARGEVVVVDDRLGITMTEIIKAER